MLAFEMYFIMKAPWYPSAELESETRMYRVLFYTIGLQYCIYAALVMMTQIPRDRSRAWRVFAHAPMGHVTRWYLTYMRRFS